MLRRPVAFVIVILCVGLCSCDSAEKYQKQPSAERPKTVSTGEVAVSGTATEIRWAKDLTEALDAAKLRCDLEDTVGALITVDSLVRVAEGALDTLSLEHGLTSFLVIYLSDAYGSLQEWLTLHGDREAVSEVSRRYYDLADRLEARRDSAAASAP